jgi:hypothetical protein
MNILAVVFVALALAAMGLHFALFCKSRLGIDLWVGIVCLAGAMVYVAILLGAEGIHNFELIRRAYVMVLMAVISGKAWVEMGRG